MMLLQYTLALHRFYNRESMQLYAIFLQQRRPLLSTYF